MSLSPSSSQEQAVTPEQGAYLLVGKYGLGKVVPSPGVPGFTVPGDEIFQET